MNTVSELVSFVIRRVTKEESIYYCASDVGKKLGFTNVLRDVGKCEGSRLLAEIQTKGGLQKLVCVDEVTLENLVDLYHRRNG